MARVALRNARRKEDYEGLWLITFADLMVQLMAFFAIVYSFSAQDARKLQAVLGSFQQAVGLKGDGILPGSNGLDPARAADLEKLLSDLKPVAGQEDAVGVRMRIVRFRGGILFEEGDPAVPESFQPLLARIVQMSSEYQGFTLVCEGHAAPGERGKGRPSDALELSGLRAQAVLRTLAAQGLDPAHMAAEAHGDAQLDGDPASREGRALQRRVMFRFQRVAER